MPISPGAVELDYLGGVKTEFLELLDTPVVPFLFFLVELGGHHWLTHTRGSSSDGRQDWNTVDPHRHGLLACLQPQLEHHMTGCFFSTGFSLVSGVTGRARRVR